MAKLYVNLIKNGLRTIEQVPTLWREDVQALLDAEKETENETAE